MTLPQPDAGADDWWEYTRLLILRGAIRRPGEILGWTLPEVCNALEAVETDGTRRPPTGRAGLSDDELHAEAAHWRTLTPLQRVDEAKRRRGL